MQLLSALSSTASPLAMQATPMAGVAADAFAALFAGSLPEGGGEARQVAADPGKALPQMGVPPVPVAAMPVATVPVTPLTGEPVVGPVLPISASEAITMVPGEPAPPPSVRDAVPVAVAAGLAGVLKLLPEDEPVVVRQPEPRPEQLIQPMPARFAPPMPVRARRVADEPAVPTPDSDDTEPTDDGEAPVVVTPPDTPSPDLPPMIAIPADALAPVSEPSEPEMKMVGPKLPEAPVTAGPGSATAPQSPTPRDASASIDAAPVRQTMAEPRAPATTRDAPQPVTPDRRAFASGIHPVPSTPTPRHVAGDTPAIRSIDPVRPEMRVDMPIDIASDPTGDTPTPQRADGVAPKIVDPVVPDRALAAVSQVVMPSAPIATAFAAAVAPASVPRASAAGTPVAPLAGLRRTAPARGGDTAMAQGAMSGIPVARPATTESIVQPPVAAEPVARAPVAGVAPQAADPAPIVIDQPAVPFTLPAERSGMTQPVVEALTPNRQTIAGEASAPIVSVAAPTQQPVAAPPVTRVASAPAAAPAAEMVAEVVLADAPAPRSRRDDDAPPLPTPATSAIDAATLRPVAAPVTAAQPHLDTRQPQWVEGMIDRIENLRDASPTQGDTRIRLSPDALGDVEIAIRTSEDGRVHVHFSSENADAGRLLADAQPRLLQMAEARGLKLGGMQVDVGTQQQPSQRQAQDQGSPQPRAPRSAFADTQAPSTRTDNRIA